MKANDQQRRMWGCDVVRDFNERREHQACSRAEPGRTGARGEVLQSTEMNGNIDSKAGTQVLQQLTADFTALEEEEEEDAAEEDGFTVFPRAEKAERRPCTRRPPAAAGIGSAAATMGSVAASHARHSKGWRVGPPSVSMGGRAGRRGIGEGGAGGRRQEVVCAWSAKGGKRTEAGTRFWPPRRAISFASLRRRSNSVGSFWKRACLILRSVGYSSRRYNDVSPSDWIRN